MAPYRGHLTGIMAGSCEALGAAGVEQSVHLGDAAVDEADNVGVFEFGDDGHFALELVHSFRIGLRLEVVSLRGRLAAGRRYHGLRRGRRSHAKTAERIATSRHVEGRNVMMSYLTRR